MRSPWLCGAPRFASVVVDLRHWSWNRSEGQLLISIRLVYRGLPLLLKLYSALHPPTRGPWNILAMVYHDTFVALVRPTRMSTQVQMDEVSEEAAGAMYVSQFAHTDPAKYQHCHAVWWSCILLLSALLHWVLTSHILQIRQISDCVRHNSPKWIQRRPDHKQRQHRAD